MKHLLYLKGLLLAVWMLCLSSCLKEEPVAPPRPLTPLPDAVINNYKVFPSTDTLYTTKIDDNIIGFAYRDYFDDFYYYLYIPTDILNRDLFIIAREACRKVFPDSLNINDEVLSDYKVQLDIRRENGSQHFSRQWPLKKVKQ